MGVNGIYGLSGSGLDIDSMVKAGMLSKKNEYEKMQQKYTQNEWKKAEYLDLYGQVQTFSLSTLSQYKMSNTMNARGASSSNEAAVSATANATAPNMTHYVEVGQLASAAYLIGTEQLKSQNVGDKNSVKLADALFGDFKSREITSGDPNGTLYTDSTKIQEKLQELGFAENYTLSGENNPEGITNFAIGSMLVKNDDTIVLTNADSNYTVIIDKDKTLLKRAWTNTTDTEKPPVTVQNYVKGKWVTDANATKMITAGGEFKVESKTTSQITYKDASDGKTNIVDGDAVAFSFSVGDGGSGEKLVSSNESLFNISIATNVSLTETHTVDVTKAVERAKVSGSNTGLYGSQDATRLWAKMFGVDADEFENAITRYAKALDAGTATINGSSSSASDTVAFKITLGSDTTGNNNGEIAITYADLASDVSINEMVKNLNKKIANALHDEVQTNALDSDRANSLRKMQVEFRDGTLSFVNTQYGTDSKIQFGIKDFNLVIPEAPEPIKATPMLDMTTGTKLIEYMGRLGQPYASNTNLTFSYTVNDGYNESTEESGTVEMVFSDISTLSVGEFIDRLNKEFEKAGADIKAEYVWADEAHDSGTIQFSTSYVGENSKLKFDISSSGASKPFAAGLLGFEFDESGNPIGNINSDAGVSDVSVINSDIDVSKNLTDFFKLPVDEDGNSTSFSTSGKVGTVTIDGKEYTLSDTNIVTIKSKDGGRISYSLVDGATGTGVVSNVGPSNNIDVTYAQLANGYTFNDLVSAINNFGTNIRAAYDSVQDRFSIYNKESGASNQIILKMNEDDSGGSRAAEFFTKMGLAESANGELKTKTTTNNNANANSTPQLMTATYYNDMNDGEIAYPEYIYVKQRIGENGENESQDFIRLQLSSKTTEDGKRIYFNGDVNFYGFDFSTDGDNRVILEDSNNSGSYNVYIKNEPEQDAEAEYEKYEFKLGMQSVIYGTNAIAKIDGVDYTDLDSNSVNVNGVIYKFNATTTGLTEDGKVASSDNKISVTVTQDADAIVDKVKSFIEDYNKLLSKLYEWYDTRPDNNYKPLTETQREGMKDEQIEKWEAKAKAGLLYHDRTLGKIIDELRDAVGDRIDGLVGNYNTIYSIGISTTGSKGQLTLDEDKLRTAIANDSDAVYKIFTTLDKNDQYSNNGIAQRIGDVLNQGMKDIKSVSGSSAEITEDSDLNNLLRELQTKMSNFKRMMAAFEEKLYKKYDAMESSLALLGAQLNYVTGAYQ